MDELSFGGFLSSLEPAEGNQGNVALDNQNLQNLIRTHQEHQEIPTQNPSSRIDLDENQRRECINTLLHTAIGLVLPRGSIKKIAE